MNDEAELSILRERFVAAARSEWDASIVADDCKPNVEMLAAFVDNGLDEAGREYVAWHIAESPRAWELLQTMLEPGQSIPLLDNSNESSSAPVSTPLPTSKSLVVKRFDSINVYALAASALLTVTFGTMAWRSTTERRELESQLAETRQAAAGQLHAGRELVRLAKRNVDQAAAEYSPPVFVGPSDTRHTLDSLKSVISARFRGPDEPETARLNEAATEGQRSIELAVRSFPEESLNFRLEEVAILIAARKLDEADRVLKALESSHPSDPRIRNARGAWLVHKARISDSSEAEKRLALAESLLKSVVATEPSAWLNLFELYDARGDHAAAAAAVRSYAAVVRDPEIDAFVLRQFGERRP